MKSEFSGQEQGLSPEEAQKEWNNKIYRTLSGCKPRGSESKDGPKDILEKKARGLSELDILLHQFRAGLGVSSGASIESGDKSPQKKPVTQSTIEKLVKEIGLGDLTVEDLIGAQDQGVGEGQDPEEWRGMIDNVSGHLFAQAKEYEKTQEYKGTRKMKEAA